MAVAQGTARTRANRYPQSLVLRGSSGRAGCIPRFSPRSSCPGLQEGRYLEAPLRPNQQLREVSGRQRHARSEVLSARLEGEQKKRFLERIDQNDKNWKFSVNDAKERVFWKDYMHAYEDVFTHTSTKDAPWYIIPADNKWFMRLAVAAITYQTLDDLNLKYPTVSKDKKNELLESKKVLLAEKD